ncbi:low temperature requirement protein A [Agromyces silvae]|uniref:low temperature requirement protein A n=1 Tax=Agromyces silvae TaxID=3388266 RepID=UPI00280B95EB|nr:low temperature requirement protein A [Agromyces protaetiae]
MNEGTALGHGLRRMTGRDPRESHRAATPLELLFDLTFVVAFSQAGTQTAHLLEVGHIGPAIGAFAFSVFAICWAWINYSWLASAFGNDDVFFRLATLVQMVGVLVLALGLPPLFHSLDEGEHLDNGIVIAGYVIMRVSTVALWLRVARHDPALRRTALAYATLIGVAQLGWIVQIFVNPPLGVTLVITTTLSLFELATPLFAEYRFGFTPWHPHHIAERYGLLVIITLGEIVLGTILAISAVVEEQGWTFETGLVAFGGTALAFGLWWVYFTVPSGDVLARHPRRGFVWGYGHIVLFAALAGTGAGLHVAAFVIEGVAHLGDTAALVTVVAPVAVFLAALFTLTSLLVLRFDIVDLGLFVGALVVLAAAVLAVAAGASMGVGIVVAALAPVVVIVGFETVGRRRREAMLERALA